MAHLRPILGACSTTNALDINVRFVLFPLKHGIFLTVCLVGRLSSEEAFVKDQDSADWITINYKRNRGIFHDGDFPHYAAEIKHVRAGLNRVILGFNCFPAELAECNLRAPEHSDTFNRTIKLYQRLAALGLPITAPDSKSSDSAESGDSTLSSKENNNKKPNSISAKEIMKNPALAKLLVVAAKNVKAAQAREEAINNTA